jgi:hypothetical protein
MSNLKVTTYTRTRQHDFRPQEFIGRQKELMLILENIYQSHST